MIAPDAIAPPYPNPEAVEIYDDYVQALRATQPAGSGGALQPPAGSGKAGTAGASGTAGPANAG